MVELMVVFTIVGILLRLALPAYDQYVLRGHRGQARASLMQVGQWLERAATAQGTYPTVAQIPTDLLKVEGARYTITAVTTSSTFTLTATPSGRQAVDACGIFRLDHTGARSQVQITGQAVPLAADDCWSR